MPRLDLRALAFFAAAALPLAACSASNANYCAGKNPDNNCLEPAVDGGSADAPIVSCTGDPECATKTPSLPVCDVSGSKICVECTTTDHAQCVGAKPVCSTMDTCRGCQSDDECDSKVCETDTGACTSADSILYVTSGGNGSNCTQAAPCGQIMTAVGLISASRNTIKLSASSFNEQVTIADKTVDIDGIGADLMSSSGGALLTITGAATVSIRGLRIHNAGGGGGDGVGCSNTGGNQPTLTLVHDQIDSNAGFGIDATKCNVTLKQSVVTLNTSGGLDLSNADFTIVNNLIVANGGVSSNTGGLTLSPATTNYTFQFNTVSDNQSNAGTAALRGINCVIPLTLENNIITGNLPAANCTSDYSLFDVAPAVLAHNKAGLPAFKNIVTTDPSAKDYYRIGSTSAAIDMGDPASTNPIDIDGDSRPQGSGYDVGGDEYTP